MESRKSARLLNTDTDFSRLADFNIVEQVLKGPIIVGIQEGLFIACIPKPIFQALPLSLSEKVTEGGSFTTTTPLDVRLP